MLTDIMDFDPRITSDGDGPGAAYGVHCNFHYGYVHDVFDEDAKNEDACVQALRHLIAKADSEIADLEDELAILQCQRKWAESDEHKNPFVVCCAAFKRRINSLTSASQRLRDGVDTVSEVQRPAERICDIIDALIKINFTEPDEEEGDLYNDMNLVVSSGSLNIDMDVDQDAITFELGVESEKQTPLLKRLHKPTQTVSEESSSDVCYMTNDFTEKISMGPCNVEVSENLRSAELASEEKSGSLTSVETVTFLSPLQASTDEGNSKATAPRCVEIEMIKAEQDDHDTYIQHDPGVDSISRVQNHELKYPVDGHLTAFENEDQSVADLEITYGRRKTTLRHPSGENLQRKNIDDIRPSSSSLGSMSRKTTTKRKSPYIEENLGQSGSPFSELKRDCVEIPETNWLKDLETEENAVIGSSLQVSRAKTRQPTVKVPEESVGLRSPGRNIVHLKSLTPEEVKGSAIACLADKQTPRSKKELPVNLESLRKRLSEEPGFLNRLTVKELREMGKLCSFTGISKTKKDKLLNDLRKYLSKE